MGFQAERAGKVFGTKYDPMSVMQYSSSAFSKNGRPTIRSKDPRNPIPTDDIYWSDKHINKGMTDNDAFEINNVYSLHKHCEDLGKLWAYGNGKACYDGSCIKKGVRESGNTCKDRQRWDDVTTEDPTTATDTTPYQETTDSRRVVTTEKTRTKESKDGGSIFKKVFGIIHAILKLLAG